MQLNETYFDRFHQRRGTNALKFDVPPPAGARPDTIPMWIADMDFQTVPEVIDALRATAEHGIFGYSDGGATYDNAVCSWYRTRMGWDIEPGWIYKTPGVVYAVRMAVCAVTAPGDHVLICQPVYHPFAHVIEGNGRNVTVSELILQDGRYSIDFADFEAKILAHQVKAFILCSPHNPVGRVWTRDELQKMADICLAHGVIIISDEIHSDFIYAGHIHVPTATLTEAIAQNTITCTAPSKTFNLAGLQASNIIIPNDALRQKFIATNEQVGHGSLNCMAINGTKAAYLYGEPWLEALLSYLQENIRILRTGLNSIPGIDLIEPDGTYLMWLDCRKLNLSDRELSDAFLQRAGIWCNDGTMFGRGGSGFVRMNIGCTHETMYTAVTRLQEAFG